MGKDVDISQKRCARRPLYHGLHRCGAMGHDHLDALLPGVSRSRFELLKRQMRKLYPREHLDALFGPSFAEINDRAYDKSKIRKIRVIRDGDSLKPLLFIPAGQFR